MSFRSPPCDTRSQKSKRIDAYERYDVPNGACYFLRRIIYRCPFRVRNYDGEIIRAVRYANRVWPIYEPDTFVATSPKWIKEGNPIYTLDHEVVELPPEHFYLFDCDEKRLWLYD